MSSAIEWTDVTWNPATGCTKISQGCKNCYAAALAKRLKAMGQAKYANEFDYTEHERYIPQPLGWKKPRMIFVNSMSDFCHEDATADFQMQCLEVMMRANRHTYQILTKRGKGLVDLSRAFVEGFGEPIPEHIWCGVSVEDQANAGRIDDLRNVDCTTRFISFEPLLGQIEGVDLMGIDWAIIGGESGKGYRPVNGAWIESLIVQCESQNVPVFFKQWGGPTPKSGGRIINGRTYDGWPAYLAAKGVQAGSRKVMPFVSVNAP